MCTFGGGDIAGIRGGENNLSFIGPKINIYNLDIIQLNTIFAENPSILLLFGITDGSGKCFTKIKITMSKHGYDEKGNPVGYTDDNGIHWTYIGKGPDGGDQWQGGQVFSTI